MNLGQELRKLLDIENQVEKLTEKVDALQDKARNLRKEIKDTNIMFNKDDISCGVQIEDDGNFYFFIETDDLYQNIIPSKKTIKELCDFLMKHFG